MEDEFEGSREGINLNELAIIFFLGLLILFGAYFLFYDQEKYVQRSINFIVWEIDIVGEKILKCTQDIIGYLRNQWQGVKGYFLSIKNYFSIRTIRTYLLSPVHRFGLDRFEFGSCADCVIKANFERKIILGLSM